MSSSYVPTLSTYADYIREDDRQRRGWRVRLLRLQTTWWT